MIDKTDTGSLDIKQINFRSSFIDKAVKLTQVGAYDYKLPFEVNHKQEMVLVSFPMKRKQVNKYLGYLREYNILKLNIVKIKEIELKMV